MINMDTIPNRITIVRILLVPILLVFLYMGWDYLSVSLYIIACLSDIVDGRLARKMNQVSNFGKFMDPLADKILVLAAMCFIVEKGLMPGWIVAIVLLREFAVSGLRLIAVEQGKVIAAAKSGKTKTLITMVCVGFLLGINFSWLPFKEIIPPVCSALIAISTVYSGADYFIKNISVFKNSN